MKRLACGTHLILDGFGLEAEALADTELLLGSAKRLAAEWSLQGGRELLLSEDTGSSVALLARRGHVLLHAYVDEGVLVADVFGHGEGDPLSLGATLKDSFDFGRIELRVTRRGRSFPESPDLLPRAVAGDRAYAYARLLRLP